MADTCWLYLIRHGATPNNEARPHILQGQRSDPPLSALGEDQAARTSRLLAEVPFTAFYSSPLLRAVQTAQVIAEPHGLEVTPVDELIEVDVGKWDGWDWGRIERETPEAYRAFLDDPSVHPYYGGETSADVLRRGDPAIRALCGRHLGETICIVAHNVMNRTFLANLLGMPMKRFTKLPQDNCGVNLVRFRPDKVKLVMLNGVMHLEV
ncbi:MAG: histidine phosphatase family protein [Planctomycetia bacterium]|jgi:broad specificity phosphatase PhoE